MRKNVLFVFALVIPIAVNAQDGRLEINAAISTPGTYAFADWAFDEDPIDNMRWSHGKLSDITEESYNCTLYPSMSVEMAYRLSDSGTGLKGRLSLVGMAGLHMADYQPLSIYSPEADMQKAVKADVLLGLRYRIIETSHLTMYSQAMAGMDFRNESRYWTVTDGASRGGRNEFVYQLTFVGFRVKLGHRTSHLGVMTELGYGSEYVLGNVFVILPGIRAGFSYRF